MSDEVVTGNFYDKTATTNPIEKRMMAGFDAALDASLPTSTPLRILEVGVGEGNLTERVAKRWPTATLCGLDLADAERIEEWRGKPFEGVFGDIGRLPFPDDHFDLVMAIEVLEHVPDPELALQEIARVGRGAVVVSVPREPLWRVLNMARMKYLKDLGNTPGHINHWGKKGFVGLVGRHLEVREVRSPLPWTMVAASVRPS